MNFSYKKVRELYQVEADGHRLGTIGIELDSNPPKVWLSLSAGIMLDEISLQQLLDLVQSLTPTDERVVA